jgi:hypothetical protein
VTLLTNFKNFYKLLPILYQSVCNLSKLNILPSIKNSDQNTYSFHSPTLNNFRPRSVK